MQIWPISPFRRRNKMICFHFVNEIVNGRISGFSKISSFSKKRIFQLGADTPPGGYPFYGNTPAPFSGE